MNKSVNPRDALFDPEVGVTDERKVFTLNQSFHLFQRLTDATQKLRDSSKTLEQTRRVALEV